MQYFITDTNTIQDQAHFDIFYQQMPPYRKDKIDSFVRYKDKLLCLLTGITLKQALTEYNIPNGDFLIEYDKNGKPFISQNPVYFSISHSEQKVLVAISDKQIGCDIEKINNDDFLTISRQFFHIQEYEQLTKIVDKTEQLETFYKIWTTKEAIAKCIGCGLDESFLKGNDYSNYKLTFIKKDGYFATVAEKKGRS